MLSVGKKKNSLKLISIERVPKKKLYIGLFHGYFMLFFYLFDAVIFSVLFVECESVGKTASGKRLGDGVLVTDPSLLWNEACQKTSV